MQTQTVPLDQLKLSPRNARNPKTAPGVDALAANILADGQLYPLLVRGPHTDGKYEIEDGGRRFAAFKEIAKLRPELAKTIDVKILPLNGGASPHTASLSANFVRQDLHPIDIYEAFAALAADGMSVEEIAAHYGQSFTHVRQSLALGALAPEIRKAWRNGDLRDDAARAFTLCSDHKRQAKIYRDLKKQGHVWGHTVRTAILGDDHDIDRLLNFVGREAYEAAGGGVITDLFGGGYYDAEDDEFVDQTDSVAGVTDQALLKQMAEEKFEAEIERLKKQGWAFVDPADQHPNRWSYQKAKSTRSKADKAGAGCLVAVDFDGRFEVTRGVVLPKAKKAKKKAGNDAVGDDNPKPLSAALYRSLSQQATLAIQDTLEPDFDLALRLAVATLDAKLETPWTTSPLKLRRDGYVHYTPSSPDTDEDEDLDDLDAVIDDDDEAAFSRCFHAVMAADIETVQQRFAWHMARGIDAQADRPDSDTGADVLTPVLRPLVFRDALLKRFDAEDYFKRCGKARGIAAIAEMGRLDETETASWRKKKAGEVAAFAADMAKKEGWLPPELRLAGEFDDAALRKAEGGE